MRKVRKLMPCPFCWSKNIRYSEDCNCMCCDDCGTLGPTSRLRHKKKAKTKDEAISRREIAAASAWNARVEYEEK